MKSVLKVASHVCYVLTSASIPASSLEICKFFFKACDSPASLEVANKLARTDHFLIELLRNSTDHSLITSDLALITFFLLIFLSFYLLCSSDARSFMKSLLRCRLHSVSLRLQCSDVNHYSQ